MLAFKKYLVSVPSIKVINTPEIGSGNGERAMITMKKSRYEPGLITTSFIDFITSHITAHMTSPKRVSLFR
jgi:hypothetical protein